MKPFNNSYFLLLFAIFVLSRQSEACRGSYRIKINPVPPTNPNTHPKVYSSIKQISSSNGPNNLSKNIDDEEYYKLLMDFVKPKNLPMSHKANSNEAYYQKSVLDENKGFTQHPKGTTNDYPVAPIPYPMFYPTVPIPQPLNNVQEPCLSCQHHHYDNGNGHKNPIFNNGIHHHHYDHKTFDKENEKSTPLTPEERYNNFNNGLKPKPESTYSNFLNDVNPNK